jgi:tetratricopeptide (TPR) repeat protein
MMELPSGIPPAMVSVLRLLSLAALLSAATPQTSSAQAGSAPMPTGLYQAGGLGRLELSLEGDRLSAVALGPGDCGFERYRRVLRGVLQGQVLVGTLTLCLEGGSPEGEQCPRIWRQPILAFFSHKDLSLATRVRLPPGCRSPVLQGSLLQLQQEPGGATSRKGERPQSEPPRNPEAARRALLQAQQELEKGNLAQAALLFEESVEYDDRNWLTYLGLGSLRLTQQQSRAAVEALEQALALSPNPSFVPNIHYQLASAYSQLRNKERAQQYLREAVGGSYTLPPTTPPDKALAELLGDSPEFKLLTGAAAGQ